MQSRSKRGGRRPRGERARSRATFAIWWLVGILPLLLNSCYAAGCLPERRKGQRNEFLRSAPLPGASAVATSWPPAQCPADTQTTRRDGRTFLNLVPTFNPKLSEGHAAEASPAKEFILTPVKDSPLA